MAVIKTYNPLTQQWEAAQYTADQIGLANPNFKSTNVEGALDELRAEILILKRNFAYAFTRIMQGGATDSVKKLTSSEYKAITPDPYVLYLVYNSKDELISIYMGDTLLMKRENTDQWISSVFPAAFPIILTNGK